MRPLLLVSLLVMFACERGPTGLQIGETEDCLWWVSDDTPLVLTADQIRDCVGRAKINIVSFCGDEGTFDAQPFVMPGRRG